MSAEGTGDAGGNRSMGAGGGTGGTCRISRGATPDVVTEAGLASMEEILSKDSWSSLLMSEKMPEMLSVAAMMLEQRSERLSVAAMTTRMGSSRVGAGGFAAAAVEAWS